MTILKHKISKEMQLDLQLKALQTKMPPQQLQGVALVEKTKVVDDIYVKYGIKIVHLMKCA